MDPDNLSDRSPPEREKRFPSLVEALGTSREGIVLLDEDHSVLWTNPAAADFYGVSVEGMIGCSQPPMMDPTLQRVFEHPEQFSEAVREGFREHTGVGPLECHVRPEEGRKERRLLYRSEPIPDGQYQGGRIEHYTDVTAARDTNQQKELQVPHEKFKTFFDAVPDPAWVINTDGVVVQVNRALVEGMGYAREEIIGRSIDDIPFLSEEQQEAAADIFTQRRKGETFPPFPFEFQRRDGSKGYAEISARVLKEDEEFIGEIGIARDITERKRAEEQLRKSEQRFRQLANNIREVFWLTELPDGDLSREQNLYTSPVFEKVWGRPVEDLYDDADVWIEAIVPEDRERVINAREGIKEGEYNIDYRIMRPDGEIRWIHDRGFPVTDDDGNVKRIAGLSVDITERKRREEKLEAARRELKEVNEKLQQQSREDLLTGLPNKRHFNEVLHREWARHRRQKSTLSLVMADLDDFKSYNDAYGHKAGDEVLESMGDVFRTVLDRPGDLPARWGGEEFAVILPETDAEGVLFVAEQCRRAVENLNIQHEASPVAEVITMSFGTATMPSPDEHHSAELVKRADAALYRSKDRGKNCVTAFDAVNVTT